jgi:DNA-binding NarL/FixJ family response regulator
LHAWALAAERDGSPTEALARLLTMVDPQGTGQFQQLVPDDWVLLLDVVRLALAVGDTTAATAAAAACVAEADRQARPAATAAALLCRGLLEHEPVQLHQAADMFDRGGHPLVRAQALENAAILHAELGDRARARTAYADAVDIYLDLDAAWDLARADVRLRPQYIRRGHRSRRRRGTGWAALTPTEQKIAQLIATGQSNPEIAAKLVLSRRTVETHVSHILTKLDARSRIDIAVQLSQR